MRLSIFFFALATACLAETVVLKDGRQISGAIESSGVRDLRIRTSEGMQLVAVVDIQSISFETVASPSVTTAPAAQPASGGVTIPAGTVIAIRTIEAIDSANADLNREYTASVDDPVIVDGRVVVPQKSDAVLRITQSTKAGAVSGRASLSLELVAVITDGRRIPVSTGEATSKSGSQGAKAAKRGLLGAALGAGIGALAGGGKGAAIGAGIGGAAGAGTAALSGQHVQVPSEARLSFTLTQPATI